MKSVLLTVVLTPFFVQPVFAQAMRSNEAYTRPYRTVKVAAGEAGRIAEVLVKEGDTVTMGELLLKLDSRTLIAAKETAQADADATATMNALQTQLKLDERRLEQIQSILQEGAGSNEELLLAEINRELAQFKIEEALEQKKKFVLRVKEIDEQIRAREVISPMAGIVTEVHHENGEYVSAADPTVITVVDLTRLWAIFYLSTTDALMLKQGAKQDIVLSRGRTVTGTIDYIGVTTSFDSGRVKVKVLIDNPNFRIRSGIRCELADPTPTSHPVRHAQHRNVESRQSIQK